jgi:hypothetical protein
MSHAEMKLVVGTQKVFGRNPDYTRFARYVQNLDPQPQRAPARVMIP